MSFTPQYLTLDQVKVWLYGKVDFGSDPVVSMTDEFLGTLISFGEAEVERRLNKFYTVPFVSLVDDDYDSLPQVTRAYLEELMIMMSVMKVLDIDFGQKSTSIGSNYKKQIAEQYYAKMNSNFKRDETGRYNLAPLPDLKINPLMYTGLTVMPIPQVVDQFAAAGDSMVYAVQQMTKPWLSWWQFFPYGQSNCINNTVN